MATNFPTSLDSLTNPTASDKLNSASVPHATQHATLNDAVEALEAKVGVNGSAVTTSHDYLIDKQSVVPYDDASARTTAVPSPIEGQMSYLKDTNSVEVYDGSAWTAVGGGVGNANFTDTETGTYSSGGVNYKYLTFTSSGTITFDTDGLATCLIVGAGGGGGRNISATYPGGGGGAGQVLEDDFYFTAGTYTVTVGAGGAAGGGGADNSHGKMGYTSEIGKYISTPGGGGEGVYTRNGAPGASGGGGVAVNAKTTGNPPFSSATGNAGANGQAVNGGGGGGAGGGTTTSTGGVGLASTITGSSVTYGAGGNGVGGGSGTANTGNGGNGNIGTAGAGGSGIVIVRVVV